MQVHTGVGNNAGLYNCGVIEAQRFPNFLNMGCAMWGVNWRNFFLSRNPCFFSGHHFQRRVRQNEDEVLSQAF